MPSTLVAVRALLDGARLPLERENVRPLRLGALPEHRVPILVAALAPSSVRLPGELADQWLPFLWARPRLFDGRALLAEGEAGADAPAATRVAAGVPLAIAEDEESSRQLAAGWLLAYLTRMGPLYPRMISERFGFAHEIEALLAAKADGGRPRATRGSGAARPRRDRDGHLRRGAGRGPPLARSGAGTIDLVLPLSVPESQLREMLEAATPAAGSGSSGAAAECGAARGPGALAKVTGLDQMGSGTGAR